MPGLRPGQTEVRPQVSFDTKCAGGPVFVTEQEIRRSVALLAREDRTYEVPDPLGFQDYLAQKDLVVQLARERHALGSLCQWLPRPYNSFPYPKAIGGYREMSTAEPLDRLVYRILSFQAGCMTDRLLSSRVFGNRLEKPNGSSTRLPNAAWTDYREYLVATLERHDWPYTCVSDITAFYPSMDTERLCKELRRVGVPEDTVAPLQRLLVVWQTGKGSLVGLPVGGHGSGVLSNVYLLSLDGLLGRNAPDYAIYGDDFAIFDPSPTHGRAVLQDVDALFADVLRLRRNLDKTREFLCADMALDYIQNRYRSYLAAVDDSDDDGPPEHLYDFWDEDVLGCAEPNVSDIHLALGRLGRRGDSYAVPSLLARRDIIALDPKSTIGYIATTMPENEAIAERVAELLSIPATPTTEAIHLHACRYLTIGPHSPAIGAEVERVLDNRAGFRGPTRAMPRRA